MPATRPSRQPGVLIAAEGLDGSGKSAGLDALGRWLERNGRRVHLVSWVPSIVVARAIVAPRGRELLTPRVAALLAAAESADRMRRNVEGPLRRGDVVLADRYAWTGVAREVARGLDPVWVAALYRWAPRPDLILYHRQKPSLALARALASRPAPAAAEAVAAAYGDFLDRLVAAFERLLTAPDTGPWPSRPMVLDTQAAPQARAEAVKDAVRPFLENPRTSIHP